MPEYHRDDRGMWKKASPGAMLDNSVVRRDLFFLLALFVGDETVAKLQRQALTDLFQEFLHDEIVLRLASTASLLRARDDYALDVFREVGTESARERIKQFRDQHCGKLQADTTSGTEEPLVFREACNKIIHSTEYRFDVVEADTDSFISPVLYLYGRSTRGKDWRAVLDVLRYIEIGMDYTDWT